MDIRHDLSAYGRQEQESGSDVSDLSTDSEVDSISTDDGTVGIERDREYIVFPVSFEKPDSVCLRLHNLIQAGLIPKNKIFYKYLDSVTHALIDPNHDYDDEVVEFFNSIKFLGGEKTVNFIRGPMWHGCGKGGTKDAKDARMNFGGPSRTTRLKHSSGYTTKSGTIKPWIDSFLKLANDASLEVKPLIETPVIKVFGTALENDSTALKPSIQFDENQNLNVGLKDRVDIHFVAANPAPKPECLKDNVVTEANVTYLSTTDNNIAMPLSVDYKPKAGKAGEEMKEQFLNQVEIIQTCHNCIKAATSSELIIDKEAINICQSKCETCVDLNIVRNKCKDEGQSSHIPSLRACQRCLHANRQCARAVVSGNKKAFELIQESKDAGALPPQFVFICLPDAVHVAKSLKCGFANWMILFLNERACLAILHTIRDGDPALKRILPRDSVLNKDRMDVNCILHLSTERVLNHLQTIDRVVHSVVPDTYKISDTNKVGLYPHPITLCNGEHGRLLVLDYVPTKNLTRLLEARLHVPADVSVIGECSGISKSLAYCNGIAYACHNAGVQYFPVTKTNLKVRSLKKDDLIAELKKRNLESEGGVAILTYLKNVERTNKKNDTRKVQLSTDVAPNCISKVSNDMLVCASDTDKCIYLVALKVADGTVRGNVSTFSIRPRYCVCRHSKSPSKVQSPWGAGRHCCRHRKRGEFQWQVYRCIILSTNGRMC